jgi:ribosomal protein S12 methylthiotransferase
VKVHFVSLGCPKNRVDAEHMLGLAVQAGHQIVEQPEDAEAVVVNTCSFIGEAKKESIEAVLQMAKLKEQGGQKLIVSGCLAQRYVGELEGELPEVDHFIGTSDYAAITDVLAPVDLIPLSALSKKKPVDRNLVTTDLQFVAGCDMPRINSMPKYMAYMKIAEGCDNACAFCIIPKLRGKQRSRPIADLVKEARELAKSGVVELNLIAQDLTGYGHDLPGRPTLAQLLDALQSVAGIRWVRCMYAYPRTLSDDLLRLLATGRNTLPYLDIPTQHGSDRMLKLMRRGKDQKKLSELLGGVRARVPDVVLRSTVIVGFPGETEEDYEMLLEFAERVRFQRLGVFKYSDEEGTTAYDLDGKLPYAIKRRRHDKLMRRQKKIHEERMQELVGTVHEAVVEGPSEDHDWVMVGRLWSQAPEIDGLTYLSSTRELQRGEIVHVLVTEARDYDVVGEVLEADDPRIASSAPFARRAAVARAPLAAAG